MHACGSGLQPRFSATSFATKIRVQLGSSHRACKALPQGQTDLTGFRNLSGLFLARSCDPPGSRGVLQTGRWCVLTGCVPWWGCTRENQTFQVLKTWKVFSWHIV